MKPLLTILLLLIMAGCTMSKNGTDIMFRFDWGILLNVLGYIGAFVAGIIAMIGFILFLFRNWRPY